jgi:hypothetical protein
MSHLEASGELDNTLAIFTRCAGSSGPEACS